MKKLFYLSVILFLATSCGKLSRSKAKEEIIKKYNLPKDEIKAFTIIDGTMYKDLTEKDFKFKELQDEGLLTYYYEGGTGFFGTLKATLTEKGKQFVSLEKYKVGALDAFAAVDKININVAKLEFGEITGIQEIKQLNSAQVSYTMLRKDITPFGKIAFKLTEESIPCTATFTKYDDGWRIQK